MKDAIIDIQHLYFSFGKGSLQQKVLENVSLQVMPGEIIILTGPSGSGKTTLLTITGALRKAEQGSVRVLGNELVGSSEAMRTQVRRHIGFIFQQHNLLKSLTALENVCMSLELNAALTSHERRERARHMLEAVGLGQHLQHKPAELSGGQRQRVSIARALANSPQLILADEPTASLDKKSGHEAVELLSTLARERGCPILLVTHDTRILGIADRIIALEDGSIMPATT